jgi:WD40 repeat protein
VRGRVREARMARGGKLLLLIVIAISTVPARESLRAAPPQDVAKRDCFGDPLPEGVQARLGSGRMRQPSWLTHIGYSSTGKWLLSTDSEFVVLWDVETGKCVRTFKHPSGWLSSAAVSSDDTKLVCVAGEKVLTCICWSLPSGNVLYRHEITGPGYPNSVAFGNSGQVLAVRKDDGTAHLYVTQTGTETLGLFLPGKSGRGLALSPDARLLAVCEPPGGVYVYDSVTGKQSRVFSRKGAELALATFSPDGRRLAAVANREGSSEVLIWDVDTGSELACLKNTKRSIPSLAFSPDGKSLATGGFEPDVVLWDVATGKESRRCRNIGDAHHLAFAPDGKTVAGAAHCEIAQCDVPSGRRLPASADAGGMPRELRFTSDGKRIVGQCDVFRVWDRATGRELQRLPKLPAPAMWMQALSPDGKVIAASEHQGGIGLWDAATGTKLRTLTGHGGFAYALTFTPDGRRLISGGPDKAIRLWDPTNGHELGKLVGHVDSIRRLSLSGDGHWLASCCIVAGDDHTLGVWDLVHPGEPKVVNLRGGWAEDIALSPDGQLLAAIAIVGWPPKPENRPIVIWETATGRECCRLNTGQWVNTLRFSPDSRTLLTGNDKGALDLLEIATLKARRHFIAMKGFVLSAAFAPNGRWLVGSSPDAPAYVWDVSVPESPLQNASKSMDQSWAALADQDAAKAYTAVRSMIATPEKTLPYLKEHLHPAVPPRSEMLVELIRELDDKRFAVREKAAKELARLDLQAVPAIRKALNERQSAQVRQALQQLLDKSSGPVSESEALQAIRAVEVLENIQSREARALLEMLAGGDPNARLTRDSKLAIAHARGPKVAP